MTFNADLAHRVMDQIRLTPENHTQGTYRCETGMCFAGWVAEIEGLEWASLHSTTAVGAYVLVPAGEAADLEITLDYFLTDVHSYVGDDDYRTSKGRSLKAVLESGEAVLVYVADYAEVKLGLSSTDAQALFAPYNSRSQIEALIKAYESGDDELVEQTQDDVTANDPPLDDPAEYTLTEVQERIRGRL